MFDVFSSFFKLAFCWMDVVSLSSDFTSYTIFTYIFLWVVVAWLFLFLKHILDIFR